MHVVPCGRVAAVLVAIAVLAGIVVTGSAAGAAIVPADPNHTCVGDHDTLTWPAQSVSGLQGYAVHGTGHSLLTGAEQVFLDTQVAPNQTSLAFTVPNLVDMTITVSTVTNAGNTPFDTSTHAIAGPPTLGEWTVQAIGDQSATVTFARDHQSTNLNWGTVSITPVPLDPAAPLGTASQSGDTVTFSGLESGTPYYFRGRTTNACGSNAPSDSPWLVLTGTPAITAPAALPAGAPGRAYATTLTGTGGCTDPAPNTCAPHPLQRQVTAGSLPPGLELDPLTGVLSGTPTTPGAFAFTVRASAACAFPCLSNSVTRTFTLAIESGAPVGPQNVWGSAVVGGASTPTGDGVWHVLANGTIAATGDAGYYGSASGLRLVRPITGVAASRTGKGYYLVSGDGGVFTYGDAHYYGSTGGRRLNKPVFSMTPTKDGRGYWLVASDGGIFTFGDAHYYGSLGSIRLKQPIVGIMTTPSGHGYRMVARDGGVFNFGDARYYGSLGGRGYTDVVGLAATPSGNGYWVLRQHGRVINVGGTTVDAPSVHAFGDAPNLQYVLPKLPFTDLNFAHNAAVAIVTNPADVGYLVVRAHGSDARAGVAPG